MLRQHALSYLGGRLGITVIFAVIFTVLPLPLVFLGRVGGVQVTSEKHWLIHSLFESLFVARFI